MSVLKKIISILLVCVMMLSLFSCGEFKPAQGGSGNKPSGTKNPQLDSDPENDFIVQLRLGDKPFIPTQNIDVYWNDGYSVYVATVDSTGKAVVDGLDGDYRVTLSNVPAGYAYDTNAYIATNDNRIIIIDMYKLEFLRGEENGAGSGLYNCIEINQTGVYTVTIKEAGEFVYIEFGPKNNGVYSVESWVNTVDDDISPTCVAYYGHSQNKYGAYKVTKIGLCGSYTRNFIHEVNIADENISSGGSQTFTFALTAESKTGVYPIKLTFAVKFNGSFESNTAEKQFMVPTQDWSKFDFDAFNALAGGTIHNPEVPYGNSTNIYVLDEANYKICPTDGVYHVYNTEKYPETNGYGPVLVAYITSIFRFSPTIIITEVIDNKIITYEKIASFVDLDKERGGLTNINGQYDYRMFIRGFKAFADNYCHKQCRCRLDDNHVACTVECTGCRPECIRATAEEMSIVGYAEYANADGVVPVTAELKEFLQRYVSYSGYYFNDGEGYIEENYNIHSDEASQWLYACGYYE